MDRNKSDDTRKVNRPSETNVPPHQKAPDDIRKSEAGLGPHTGMRPDRFPESSMSKDQRADVERIRQGRGEKDSSDIEQLADDVKGTVGSRETGSSPQDIAGVADLDRGLRRRRRK